MTRPAPITRRDRIVFLLENLADCCGESSGLGGQGEPGEPLGFALISSMADHPSVIELGRCLALLRRMAPNHGRYVDAYYGCGWHVDRLPVTRKKGNRTVRVVERDGTPAVRLERRRSLPAWLKDGPVDPKSPTGERLPPLMVSRGIDFISAMFEGDPAIPKQLREAA